MYTAAVMCIRLKSGVNGRKDIGSAKLMSGVVP